MLSKWEVEHYGHSYRTQLNKLVDTLEQRLLPTFAHIDKEADKVRSEAVIEMENFRGEFDQFAMSEAATEAGFTHYETMSYIKQALLNMFASGLYHLFEQQIREFHTKVLRRAPLRFATEVLAEWDKSLSFETLSPSQKLGLNELHLLANTVKHGDGNSATRLYEINPRLFQDAWEEDFTEDSSVTVRKPNVSAPLFGKDIFVELEDMRRYLSVLCEAWSAYLVALQAKAS